MREFIKAIARFGALVAISPIIVIHHCIRFAGHESAFAGFSQFMSLFPGKSGSYLRVAFYRFSLTGCSPNCVIGFGTLFSQADTEIGERVYIGPQCNIGSCRIGSDCLIASGVHILSGKMQHRHEDLNVPIQQQGGVFEKISIGKDSWIGNGAIVMANVGEKCIVGAGSVVVDEVSDHSIMAGNPARIIRSRNDDAAGT